MNDISLITMALVVGFFHSFEADHLAAVSNLVSTERTAMRSLQDGIYWGVGHTITIFVVGILILLLKFSITEDIFSQLEGIVGIMLVLLGVFRLYRMITPKKREESKNHQKLALGVGMIHGMAGSGAVIALAVSATSSPVVGLVYLLIFGIGSIVGMLFAAFILGKILHIPQLEKIKFISFFSIFSSLFCIIFGLKIVLSHFFHISIL